MEATGIIMPPKALRELIHSTAEAVAKNGVKLEELIYKNDESENKFSFLKLDSPYRRYYDKMVVEYAKNLINPLNKNSETNKLLVEYQNKEIEPNEEEEIEGDFDFCTNQPQMTIEQDQIIKLTAQYVSVNGEEFLENIAEIKKNEEDFAFLKPNHPFFNYFTILIDSYIELKNLNNIDINKLDSYIKNEESILRYCQKKYEEQKNTIKQKKEMIVQTEENNNDYDYDWNNFRIVKVINFNDNEIFYNSEKFVDENKYRINPEFSFIFDTLRKTKIPFKEEEQEKNEIFPKPGKVKNENILMKCQFCKANLPQDIMNSHYKEHYKMKNKNSVIEKNIVTIGEVKVSENLEDFLTKRKEMYLQEEKYEIVEKPEFLKN